MVMWQIKESGRNGSVEITPDALIRTVKKRLGRDDRQMIPLRAISSVHHDRKRVKTDAVRIVTSAEVYEWKVTDAESFVEELHTAIAAR